MSVTKVTLDVLGAPTSAGDILSSDGAAAVAVGTASATTFKIRAGQPAAAETTFNGIAVASRKLGGVMNSYMRIEEIFV